MPSVSSKMYLAKGFVLCLFLALGSFGSDQECQESDWSPCCLPCGKKIQPFSHRLECINGQGIWKFKSCSDSISNWSNWENCSSNVCNEEGIQTRKRVACEGTLEELESKTCVPDQDTCLPNDECPQPSCPYDVCADPEVETTGQACIPVCTLEQYASVSTPPCPKGVPICPGEKDSNGCKVTEDTCAPGMYFLVSKYKVHSGNITF